MSAATVFQTLAARGAVVTVRGDVLSIAPRTAIDEPLRAEIRAQKYELLELLSAAQSKPTASTCTGFAVRAAYEPAAAAAYARELHRRDEISAEQRDNLLSYADAAADNPKADITQNENGGEL